MMILNYVKYRAGRSEGGRRDVRIEDAVRRRRMERMHIHRAADAAFRRILLMSTTTD